MWISQSISLLTAETEGSTMLIILANTKVYTNSLTNSMRIQQFSNSWLASYTATCILMESQGVASIISKVQKDSVTHLNNYLHTVPLKSYSSLPLAYKVQTVKNVSTKNRGDKRTHYKVSNTLKQFSTKTRGEAKEGKNLLSTTRNSIV